MRVLASLSLALTLTTAPALARTSAPVVVELFTAQGCSSCNAANQLVGKLADRRGLIVLTWAVDYWDYLGWKDSFAQPAFTARQKTFDHRLGVREVYTPQIILDGARQVSGDDTTGLQGLIAKAAAGRRRALVGVTFLADGGLSVRAHTHRRLGAAEVWLARVDPRAREVEITAGDNRGATVSERRVVRQLVRLGAWNGHATTFRPPPAEEAGLNDVVLVQGARGGPILAAAERTHPDPAPATAARR